MTRTQLLQLLIQQARTHGFAFRKWFPSSTGIPWTGADHAVEWLSRGERAHLLLFSHDFARHFWQSGGRISFLIPQQTFQRVLPDGRVHTVHRKAHMRHSSHDDVWRFHLREMAAHAEPLRYIRRFLIVEEVLAEEAAAPPAQDEDADDR